MPLTPCVAIASILRCIIGERERANLVVQLARFFYIFVCMSPYRNPLRNSKYTSAKFHVHRVSRMR